MGSAAAIEVEDGDAFSATVDWLDIELVSATNRPGGTFSQSYSGGTLPPGFYYEVGGYRLLEFRNLGAQEPLSSGDQKFLARATYQVDLNVYSDFLVEDFLTVLGDARYQWEYLKLHAFPDTSCRSCGDSWHYFDAYIDAYCLPVKGVHDVGFKFDGSLEFEASMDPIFKNIQFSGDPEYTFDVNTQITSVTVVNTKTSDIGTDYDDVFRDLESVEVVAADLRDEVPGGGVLGGARTDVEGQLKELSPFVEFNYLPDWATLQQMNLKGHSPYTRVASANDGSQDGEGWDTTFSIDTRVNPGLVWKQANYRAKHYTMGIDTKDGIIFKDAGIYSLKPTGVKSGDINMGVRVENGLVQNTLEIAVDFVADLPGYGELTQDWDKKVLGTPEFLKGDYIWSGVVGGDVGVEIPILQAYNPWINLLPYIILGVAIIVGVAVLYFYIRRRAYQRGMKRN